jgi:hypothetical protein
MVAGPGGDKVVEAYVTNNVTLDLPGLHGEGHAVLVLEKDYLELRNYLGTDVQGVLGYEIFSRFIVQIDYKEKEVTIIRPEFFQPGKRYEMLPMHVEDTKPYNCLLTVEPVTDWFWILPPTRKYSFLKKTCKV